MLEPGDAGKFGEEIVCGFGGNELRLAQEVAGFGVLHLLLGWSVEDTHGLRGGSVRDEIGT